MAAPAPPVSPLFAVALLAAVVACPPSPRSTGRTAGDRSRPPLATSTPPATRATVTTAATVHATTRLPTVHHLPCRRADVIVFDDATAPPVPATSGKAAGPVGGDHGGDLRWAEPGGGEGVAGPVGHPPGQGRLDQGDGAAAEAGPGHAGPDRPRRHGRLDGGVELGRGHLVVVAQRGVGGGQQRAQPVQVAGPE